MGKISLQLVLTAVLMLCAGCATFGQMDKGLDSLVGQKEQVAFDVLGYPDAKNDIGGATVYIWGRQSTGVYYAPQTRTTYGNVGGTSYTANTTYYAPQVYSAECTIKIIVNNGIISNYDYYGNLAGCEGFISRLKNYTKQNEILHSNESILEKIAGDEYSTNPGSSYAYIDCLKKEAPEKAKNTKNFEELKDSIDAICKNKSNGYSVGMAAYYARQALDNK